MGALMDQLKVRKAIGLQQKGMKDEAMQEYEKLYQAGVIQPNYLLPYTVLLLKKDGKGNAEKVKEILKKVEKFPGLSPQQKQQVHLNYACAQYQLGKLSEAINLLEASMKKYPMGTTYQALGYLYVEAGDVEKGLSFNQEALEYDDEDPIVIDNMGQYYYRVLGDKQQALPYFEKAHQINPDQLDTLYFLARYDLEAGRKKEALEKLEKVQKGSVSPLNYATPERVGELIAQCNK